MGKDREKKEWEGREDRRGKVKGKASRVAPPPHFYFDQPLSLAAFNLVQETCKKA